MSATHYNPNAAPNPAEWLALSEMERIRLVQNHHASVRVKVSNMKAHAALHAAVENQVASGYGPTNKALERLQGEGLSRHEAVHAVASVIVEFVRELSIGQAEQQRVTYQSRMGEAIANLQAKCWLSGQAAPNHNFKRAHNGAA